MGLSTPRPSPLTVYLQITYAKGTEEESSIVVPTDERSELDRVVSDWVDDFLGQYDQSMTFEPVELLPAVYAAMPEKPGTSMANTRGTGRMPASRSTTVGR